MSKKSRAVITVARLAGGAGSQMRAGPEWWASLSVIEPLRATTRAFGTSIDVSSVWAFVAAGAVGLIDGVVPLIPARTTLIGLGVLARSGDYWAYPLLLTATCGAFVSDNISYWIGSRYWSRVGDRLLSRRSFRRLWEWAQRQVVREGAFLVVISRIIPGGPTPITMMAGSIGMSRRRFRLAALASVTLWTAYAYGTATFGDLLAPRHPLVGFAAAVGLAFTLGGSLRLVLWVRQRRRGAQGGKPPDSRAF